MSAAYVFEHAACPRCGSDEGRTRLTGRDYLHETPGEFTACECVACGLWFQNPRPDAATIAHAYPSEYAPHAAVGTFDPPLDARTMTFLRTKLGYPRVPLPAVRAPRWWQRWRSGVDLIPHWVADGSLLEIGAASGGRLRALRELGWPHLTGIELMPAAAGIARADGFDVRIGTAESVIQTFPDAAFDVVIASFVLEHLYDPFQLVNEVTRVLKPGGEFLFSTITRDSIEARTWGKYWGGFDFPRHLVYFGTRDLRQMLENDFHEIEEYRHHAPQDFSRSAWWRLMERRNLVDRIVGRLVKTAAGKALGQGLAWAGLTSRISIRSRRRAALDAKA